jgi:competence protein ComEC
VIKAPHHGSNTGNSQLFFNRNIIKNGIISCGINNRYGHPGTEFLKIMEKEKINVYRTDLQGTITVEYNGKEDFKIIPFLD